MSEDEKYSRLPLIKQREGGKLDFSDEFEGIILDTKGEIVGCLLSNEKYINILSFEGEDEDIPLVILDKKTQNFALGREMVEKESPSLKDIGKDFVQTMMDRKGIVKKLVDKSPQTLTNLLNLGKTLEKKDIDTEIMVEEIKNRNEEGG